MSSSDHGKVFPRSATIAGTIWTVVGILGCFGVAINLFINLGIGAANPNAGLVRDDGGRVGVVFVAILGLIIYGSLLLVGVQTVQGTAKGLLVGAVGSLVLSTMLILGGGWSCVQTSNPPRYGPPPNAVAMLITGGFLLVAGVAMLLAGVLGLTTNEAYKNWRRAAVKSK